LEVSFDFEWLLLLVVRIIFDSAAATSDRRDNPQHNQAENRVDRARRPFEEMAKISAPNREDFRKSLSAGVALLTTSYSASQKFDRLISPAPHFDRVVAE